MQLGVHFILPHLQLTTVQLKYVEMSLLSWADLIHLMHSLLFGLLACLWCSTEFTYSSAWPIAHAGPNARAVSDTAWPIAHAEPNARAVSDRAEPNSYALAFGSQEADRARPGWGKKESAEQKKERLAAREEKVLAESEGWPKQICTAISGMARCCSVAIVLALFPS